jgi:hypothetical protein
MRHTGLSASATAALNNAGSVYLGGSGEQLITFGILGLVGGGLVLALTSKDPTLGIVMAGAGVALGYSVLQL